MTIKETLARLDALYEKTGVDWTLEISLTITEPVAAWVAIRPEGTDMMRYAVTADRDEIEGGVAAAVGLVYTEIIWGAPITVMAPFTNPDDRAFEAARADGKSVREALALILQAHEEADRLKPGEE